LEGSSQFVADRKEIGQSKAGQGFGGRIRAGFEQAAAEKRRTEWEQYSSLLDHGEELIKHTTLDLDTKLPTGRWGDLYPYKDAEGTHKGRLLLSNRRLLLVDEIQKEGFLTTSSQYNVVFTIPLESITNCRLERGGLLSGTPVVVSSQSHGQGVTTRLAVFDSGNEWIAEIKGAMDRLKGRDLSRNKMLALLRSQERTRFGELTSVDARLDSDSKIVEFLQDQIMNEQIKGFIDKGAREFVHETAYQQKKEVIQYNIAASFNFNEQGALEIRCPNCGASHSQTERASRVTCKSCKNEYVIPKKILDLI
jgi:hypothetical protein